MPRTPAEITADLTHMVALEASQGIPLSANTSDHLLIEHAEATCAALDAQDEALVSVSGELAALQAEHAALLARVEALEAPAA